MSMLDQPGVHGEHGIITFPDPDAEMLAEYERMSKAFGGPFDVYRIDPMNSLTPQELDAIARDWKFDDTPAPRKEPSETERRWAHNRKQRAKGRK